MYVYHDFSKTDKKLFEPLLELSVQNKIAKFAQETLPMNQALAIENHQDIRVPYWELAEKFIDFSKYLTHTFDNYRHRELPSKIAHFIISGDLKMEDLSDFSEVGKKKMEEIIAQFRSWK